MVHRGRVAGRDVERQPVVEAMRVDVVHGGQRNARAQGDERCSGEIIGMGPPAGHLLGASLAEHISRKAATIVSGLVIATSLSGP